MQTLDTLEQDIIKKLNTPVDLEAPVRPSTSISQPSSGPEPALSGTNRGRDFEVVMSNAPSATAAAAGPRGGQQVHFEERRPSRWPNLDMMQFMDGADGATASGRNIRGGSLPSTQDLLSPTDRERGIKLVVCDADTKEDFRRYIKERDR